MTAGGVDQRAAIVRAFSVSPRCAKAKAAAGAAR
jgi:predicted ABC-type transport system involved in lysophospholipase L1 biosynthesis ATPase subunit